MQLTFQRASSMMISSCHAWRDCDWQPVSRHHNHWLWCHMVYGKDSTLRSLYWTLVPSSAKSPMRHLGTWQPRLQRTCSGDPSPMRHDARGWNDVIGDLRPTAINSDRIHYTAWPCETSSRRPSDCRKVCPAGRRRLWQRAGSSDGPSSSDTDLAQYQDAIAANLLKSAQQMPLRQVCLGAGKSQIQLQPGGIIHNRHADIVYLIFNIFNSPYLLQYDILSYVCHACQYVVGTLLFGVQCTQ